MHDAMAAVAHPTRVHWEDHVTKASIAEILRLRRCRCSCGAFAAPALAADVGACLITKTDTNPFFVKMKEGATAKAKELGVKLKAFAGKIDGDNEGQVAAIEILHRRRRQGHPARAVRHHGDRRPSRRRATPASW